MDARKGTRLAALAVVVVSTIGCDRLTKNMAVQHLAGRSRLSFAADSVRLEYVENRGGFLSLGAELPEQVRTGIFSVGTAVLLAWLGAWALREVGRGRWAVGAALVWAGGSANLADRLVRGSVVDFLNVGVGTVRTGIFNVADVAITFGAALLVAELSGRRDVGRPPASACRRTKG